MDDLLRLSEDQTERIRIMQENGSLRAELEIARSELESAKTVNADLAEYKSRFSCVQAAHPLFCGIVSFISTDRNLMTRLSGRFAKLETCETMPVLFVRFTHAEDEYGMFVEMFEDDEEENCFHGACQISKRDGPIISKFVNGSRFEMSDFRDRFQMCYEFAMMLMFETLSKDCWELDDVRVMFADVPAPL